MTIKPGPSRRERRGFITILMLAIAVIMLLLIMVNRSTVIRLRREVAEIEKRQVQRANGATNQAPASARPAEGSQPK